MHRNTWKSFERAVAAFFGTERTPLSGGNSKITRSDTLHPMLFIECKQREFMAVWGLWEATKAMADKEHKTPVLALKQNHKNGFLICVHCDNIENLLALCGDYIIKKTEMVERLNREQSADDNNLE